MCHLIHSMCVCHMMCISSFSTLSNNGAIRRTTFDKQRPRPSGRSRLSLSTAMAPIYYLAEPQPRIVARIVICGAVPESMGAPCCSLSNSSLKPAISTICICIRICISISIPISISIYIYIYIYIYTYIYIYIYIYIYMCDQQAHS